MATRVCTWCGSARRLVLRAVQNTPDTHRCLSGETHRRVVEPRVEDAKRDGAGGWERGSYVGVVQPHRHRG